MEIIKYNNTQINACANLFVKVFNAGPWNDNWTIKKAAVLLSRIVTTPGFKGFVGIVNNNIAAVCFGYTKTWWNSEEYYIEEMFVEKVFQRSGNGSKMIGHIYKELKNENINAITLLTGQHTPAQEFYEKNGFQTLSNMIFMKKKL